jgi:GntR family transcriptional repressor for pyruvate dehydrogenase complex
MKRNVGVVNINRFVQHDLEFHSVINGATGNPLVDVMCNAMHECMLRTMQVGILNLRAKSEVLKVVENHDQIATAIDDGNSVRAGVLMKKHFEDAKKATSPVE